MSVRVDVCARACARAEGEPGEPRGGRCAPAQLTRGLGEGTVRPGVPPRSEQAATILLLWPRCGLHPAGSLHVAAAADACKGG